MQKINFEIKQGDTFNIQLDLSSYGLDLSGATFSMVAEKLPSTITWSNLSVTDNVIDLTKSASVTTDWFLGYYNYDGKVTQSDGTVTTVVEGYIHVRRSYT